MGLGFAQICFYFVQCMYIKTLPLRLAPRLRCVCPTSEDLGLDDGKSTMVEDQREIQLW